MMIAIITAGIAPGLAILSYFYLKDQYDTEPFYMVLRSFILGLLLVFPIMFLQYVFEMEKVFSSTLFDSYILTGFLEEFFKWFILYVSIFQHLHFDEHYDGIVYGVAVSLGFATLENILYLLANGVEYALGRAFLPVSSHALFGVLMGYYMGKSKFSGVNRSMQWLLLSIVIPIFLHGSYDYIIVTHEDWHIFMIPFMLILWWFALHKAKKARVVKQKLTI
jgi:protease PrsW